MKELAELLDSPQGWLVALGIFLKGVATILKEIRKARPERPKKRRKKCPPGARGRKAPPPSEG